MHIETDSDAGRLRGIIADYFSSVDRAAWPISVAKSVAEIAHMPTVSFATTTDIRTAIIDHLVTCGFNVQFDETGMNPTLTTHTVRPLRLGVSTAVSQEIPTVSQP